MRGPSGAAICAPHERRGELTVHAEFPAVKDRRRHSMNRFRGTQGLRTLEKSISGRHAPCRVGVDGESSRVRIETDRIEAPPLLIRFAAIEGRAFEFPMCSEETGRQHTKADVGRILPMVGKMRPTSALVC